jgi:hypothetical protein
LEHSQKPFGGETAVRGHMHVTGCLSRDNGSCKYIDDIHRHFLPKSLGEEISSLSEYNSLFFQYLAGEIFIFNSAITADKRLF